jgi:hypothetical protein
MAAQPPIPPSSPAVVPAPVIPPAAPDPLQAALEFARATAKDEIESIKRLHDRTLLSLTILFVFLGAVGGVVGWVGYKNLRDTAVQLAQKTVKDEIEKQMTSMNVDQIIENRLNEKTGVALTFTIRDAVAAEAKKQGMSSQINQAVTAQVEELRKQLLKTQRITAQRTFTPEQATLLKDASQPFRAKRFKVKVIPFSSTDFEELAYANQLMKALGDAGWTSAIDLSTPVEYLPLRAGVFLTVGSPKYPPPGAVELQQALKHAKVDAPFVQTNTPGRWDDATGHYDVPTLVISSRPTN